MCRAVFWWGGASLGGSAVLHLPVLRTDWLLGTSPQRSRDQKACRVSCSPGGDLPSVCGISKWGPKSFDRRSPHSPDSGTQGFRNILTNQLGGFQNNPSITPQYYLPVTLYQCGLVCDLRSLTTLFHDMATQSRVRRLIGRRRAGLDRYIGVLSREVGGGGAQDNIDPITELLTQLSG